MGGEVRLGMRIISGELCKAVQWCSTGGYFQVNRGWLMGWSGGAYGYGLWIDT